MVFTIQARSGMLARLQVHQQLLSAGLPNFLALEDRSCVPRCKVNSKLQSEQLNTHVHS
jgi:hypothetical protein